MNIIIPLCGIGKRFTDAGYELPKPLIQVFDKHMICHVLDNLVLNENDKIFIIYHHSLDEYQFSKIINSLYPHINLIPIFRRTDGAAETILFGISTILNMQMTSSLPCLLIDCDTIYNTNIIKKLRNISTNAVIYFEDTDSKPIYSYITLNDKNDILDIKEKEKISNFANTGAYYFKDIYDLQEGCSYICKNNVRFKNEYYTSCVIKYLLTLSKPFKGIKINRQHYISLGTPEELSHYVNHQMSLLFDLDGTLVKTDEIYFKVWSTILSDFNVTLTHEMFESCIQGNTDTYAMKRLQISNTLYNIDNISKQKDELFSKYIHDIKVIDGVYSFIKGHKKLGYHICIVSNCNRQTCEDIIKYLKIDKYINYIIIGNECARSKPYPDPYLKAISLLKTTSDKCIIFEDSKPGLLSAMDVLPYQIVGINNGTNLHILKELGIKNIIHNYNNLTIHSLMQMNDYENHIKSMIMNSLSKQYDINNSNDITIYSEKLKGGYISDVIKISIKLASNTHLDCVLKYENDYTTSLTKMARLLGLFDREYYFYESISNYITINVPKYIGTIKDSNFVSKGIILENINKPEFHLALDLNKEPIDTSLQVINQCARMHSQFWGKDLSKSFNQLKKHNDSLFRPVWGNFIRERWEHFKEVWSHIISESILSKMEIIVHTFDEIQEHMSHGNLTLCHGDVKSGNIFYKESTNGYMPYFIDWQYIAHGKGVQDIVFFMIESFTTNNIEKYSDIFKHYYYIKLQEMGISNYSMEEYNNDFKYAICYFPFFVAIWFGTTPQDELIDVQFPEQFIKKLTYFINKYL